MDTPAGLADAVEAIARFNQHRDPRLVAIKYARMADNVFAFFRGTDHLFADRWPRFRPADEGPAVLICGDLHLENFGAYQTDDGDFRFDINDFDEAIVAPCSLDVVRALASILLAAEVWAVSAVPASRIAIGFLTAYHDTVIESARQGSTGEVKVGAGKGPIFERLGEIALGSRTEMLDRQTQLGHHGVRHIIRTDDKHPDVGKVEAEAVRMAIEQYGRSTPTPEAYAVLDVAGRIAGVGSLGVRRYTVLIAGDGTPDTNRLLDVKEATASCLAAEAVGPQWVAVGNEAQRVVAAQRQLQSKPAAGLAAIEIDGRPYRLREMVPDENRSKLDRLQKKPDKLRDAVGVAGQLSAWSHVRGCQVPNGASRQKAFVDWVESSAFDSVLAAAARCVELTSQDFEAYSQSFAEHRLESPAKG
jgi:uncharacterized protein (DUF2252 family)